MRTYKVVTNDRIREGCQNCIKGEKDNGIDFMWDSYVRVVDSIQKDDTKIVQYNYYHLGCFEND